MSLLSFNELMDVWDEQKDAREKKKKKKKKEMPWDFICHN